MNVERNPKTFNCLFSLFVKMGEERLGRPLTAEEINKLRPSIAKKCETISKKDIVREIYNLEKSNREQKHGKLSLKEKMDLKKKIHAVTKCPVKYTSSSDDLVKAVSNSFANIHVYDALKRNPSLKLKAPEVLNAEKRKLKNSYINDKFHYKAPSSLSDKMKRFVALGGAVLIAAGIGTMVHFNNPQTPIQDETTISETSTQESLTPKDYLIDCITPDNEPWVEYNASLSHFKSVFTNEFNNMNNSELSSGYIQMRSVPHTFIYELTDNNGQHFYITKGNSPGTTEDLVQRAGYDCKRINDFDNDVDVISVVTDSGNFIAACAWIDGKMVPICADGSQFTDHAPSQQELNSGYSNIINANSVADAQLLANLCSTGAFRSVCNDNRDEYADCLLEYIGEHSDSQLAQEINSAIKEATHVQTNKNTKTAEIEDEELEF